MVDPVHPHARGEHGRIRALKPSIHGSSPRPWGTRPDADLHHGVARFIPTPVGNTVLQLLLQQMGSVHPHARGEHLMSVSAEARDGGSSPRPWGTQAQAPNESQPGRFIPTPVGNTACSRSWRFIGSVHPHARGEHTNPISLVLLKKFQPRKSTNSKTQNSNKLLKIVDGHVRMKFNQLNTIEITGHSSVLTES